MYLSTYPRTAMLTFELRTEALIMCPSSFEIKSGSRPGRTRVIGDTKPNTRQNLDELEPRSLTFLHEVIHVVRGNAATIPERCMYFCEEAESSKTSSLV